MGLMKEAVKGGEDREETERETMMTVMTVAILASRRNFGGLSCISTNDTPERGSPLLKNTLLDFKNPQMFRSKSQTCCQA